MTNPTFQILIDNGLSIIITALTGIVAFIFGGKRKQDADLRQSDANSEGTMIENISKGLDLYQRMLENIDAKKEKAENLVEELNLEKQELTTKIFNLTLELKKCTEINK